jgi:hypothetical protein
MNNKQQYRAIDKEGRISEPFELGDIIVSVLTTPDEGYFLSISEAVEIIPYDTIAANN